MDRQGPDTTLSPMAQPLKLTTVLEPRGPAGAFILTDDQVAALGEGRKAFPVTVAVNGVTLPLRLARMKGENLIGLAKAARDKAGLAVGDAVEVVIAPDSGERTVEVPDDLAAALAAVPAAEAAFNGMAFSHRKEYVRWVTEAKKEATRADRIAKTIEMVQAGQVR